MPAESRKVFGEKIKELFITGLKDCLKTNINNQPVLSARISFFVCVFNNCHGKYEKCYAKPEKCFFLLSQYADPVEDAIENSQLTDGCLHHRDGLFSLSCRVGYCRFSNESTYNNDVQDKFCSLFFDNTTGIRFNAPNVSQWHDRMKMSQVIGLNFSEYRYQHRVILAIESRSPIDAGIGCVNAPRSSVRLGDVCPDADRIVLCDQCLKEPENRVGCQRVYPKIKLLVNELLKNRSVLENTDLLFSGKQCPYNQSQT